jgi:hypothetical protein
MVKIERHIYGAASLKAPAPCGQIWWGLRPENLDERLSFAGVALLRQLAAATIAALAGMLLFRICWKSSFGHGVPDEDRAFVKRAASNSPAHRFRDAEPCSPERRPIVSALWGALARGLLVRPDVRDLSQPCPLALTRLWEIRAEIPVKFSTLGRCRSTASSRPAAQVGVQPMGKDCAAMRRTASNMSEQ